MRSFSRRIAGFILVRNVYTWARAVEMAAVLVRRVHLRSYARIRTSANGGAGAGRGASVSKSSRTFSSVIHALA